MRNIQITENKVYYVINDTRTSFMCRVSKKSLPNLQKLLIDCLKGKLPTSIFDNRYYELHRWFFSYGCKGSIWSARKDRIVAILLSMSIYKDEIRNKQDIAKALGFKTYCKSVDNMLKSLPLPSVAMLYNKIKKGDYLW